MSQIPLRTDHHYLALDLALKDKIAVIGWEALPDLSGIKKREQLSALLAKAYPDAKSRTRSNWESQIWSFVRLMKSGHLVALPLKSRSFIAIGEVTGEYKYRPDLPANSRHTRPVEWVAELPRGAFNQDLLYSLGAFLTVCRIQRNRAEDRVRLMLGAAANALPAEDVSSRQEPTDLEAVPDLEQYARDQIRSFISSKFRGHALTTLVAAILEAQGYKVKVSPEGPDGGVDIIAGRGPLGFDPPRLAVQVKSGDSPVDVKVLRELQGVMKNFGAEQGPSGCMGWLQGNGCERGLSLVFRDSVVGV